MFSKEIFDEKLTGADLRVYIILCEHMSLETATCFPSYKTIAKKAGYSRITAINSVNKLVKKGLIAKDAVFSDEGDRASNKYTLLLELKRLTEYRRKKKNKTIDKEENKQDELKKEENKQDELKKEENKQDELKKEKNKQDELEKINIVKSFITETLAEKEIEALLKAADGNIEKIKEKYEIAKSQSCTNLVGFLIKAIKNNYQPNKSIKKKNKFVNYTERKIDPKMLEEVEQKTLARKMEEIDRNLAEKAKEEKVSEEKPEIILHHFTQSELNEILAEYKETFEYGLSLVGRPITKNMFAQGLDFSYKFLPEADLSNSDLTGADLTGINLEQANLTKVKFVQAKLNNANLKDVDLTNADLTGADLSDADLTGANLRKAKLTGIRIKGAKLKKLEIDLANKEYLRSLEE